MLNQSNPLLILDEILDDLCLQNFFNKKSRIDLETLSFKASNEYQNIKGEDIELISCKYCHDVLNNPYYCKECEENFCKRCLLNEKSSSEFKKMCPNETCKKTLIACENKEKTLSKLLYRAEINCPLSVCCNKKFELQNLPEHALKCESIPSHLFIYQCQFCLLDLTNFNNSNEIKIEFYKHLKKCGSSDFECKKCFKNLNRNELLFHFKNNCLNSDIDVEEDNTVNENQENQELSREIAKLKDEVEKYKKKIGDHQSKINNLEKINKKLMRDLTNASNQILSQNRTSDFSVEKVYEYIDRISKLEDDQAVEKETPDGKTTFLANGKKIVNLQKNQSEAEKNSYLVYQLAINTIYCGEMKNKKFHGKGIYYTPSGDKYKGEFREDNFDGYGEYSWNNESQDLYQGEWKLDKRHGYGIFFSDNKQFYIGEFKNDEFNGIGINNNEDFKYEGEFEDHVIKGAGIKVFNSTSNNNGIDEDSERNEYFCDENNNDHLIEKFEGVWDKFELTGIGELYQNDRLVYFGEFKEGHFHGKGTKINKNGSVFEGQFKNGFEHGLGRTIIYVNDHVSIKGHVSEWKNGFKVGTAIDWVELANKIMIRISRNKLAKEFNKSMCTLKYPDYHEKITNPMDFNTIKSKLRREGEYTRYNKFEDLKQDFNLVIRNIETYFGKDSKYIRNAERLQKHFDTLVVDFDLK